MGWPGGSDHLRTPSPEAFPSLNISSLALLLHDGLKVLWGSLKGQLRADEEHYIGMLFLTWPAGFHNLPQTNQTFLVVRILSECQFSALP